MALAGADTSLIGGRRRDERGNRGIISPKTGIVLLVAAFGCAMMAEVVFNGGVLAGRRGELVSSIRHQKKQQRPFHQLEATGNVHRGKDTGAAIDAAIRGVPLVGETVADGLNRVTGGKVRKDSMHVSHTHTHIHTEAHTQRCACTQLHTRLRTHAGCVHLLRSPVRRRTHPALLPLFLS